ncbi:hypothetical protein C0995_007358 [Termitomyces sp. Mi166|nr:hypothetical protein C0995_007358 [Termitomyces sp. Mi166\
MKDEWADTIFKDVLDFNPPGYSVDYSAYPKLASPLTFYDKHIDKRLSLRKVTLASSLTSDLAQAVHDAFTTIKNDDRLQLPSVDAADFPVMRPEMTNEYRLGPYAKEVAIKYQLETAFSASIIASMLLLHPNSPVWTRVFRFTEHSALSRYSNPALIEDYAPDFLKPYTHVAEPFAWTIPKEAWDAMERHTQEEVIQAKKRFRFLAVWQMFYIRREARRALKRMDTLTLKDIMPTPSFHTHTPPYEPNDGDLRPSPDAVNTAWGVSVASFVNAVNSPKKTTGLRRSTRLSILASKEASHKSKKPVTNKKAAVTPLSAAERIFQWKDVTIPSGANSTCTDEEMGTLILQHAWARAVERDSTFIVLHCGNYERIAFRHRSSRTLFISDLIKVGECSDPAYGAIHIGLYISILKDVLDRTRQLMDADANEQPKKRKRKTTNYPETRKRPKTRAGVALEQARKLAEERNFKVVYTEASHRSLALLRIQHSHYNSSVPASFIRYDRSKKVDKLTYKPREYFCITLTSPLGIGATGDAHEGVIDLMGPSGDSLSLPNIVVKFAFRPDERQRLRHEFKVYEHLKSSRVTGIPHHFGLFKDVESDTLALVMTKGGTSLPDRKTRPDPDIYDPSFMVSKSERADFINTLEMIHAAGVRHRDIRGANLVVNEDGNVNIIDFDRASLKSRKRTIQLEMEHLISVLDGDHAAVGLEFVSRGSFRESESPSAGPGSSWEKSEDDSDRQHTAERDTNYSWGSGVEESGEDGDSEESDSDGSQDTVTSLSWARLTSMYT